jgi:hypothetical protein
MLNAIRSAAIVVLFTNLVGCGGGGGGGDGGTPPATDLQGALQGAWASACVDAGGWTIETCAFNGGNITFAYSTYSTAACTGTPTHQGSKSPGPFVVGAAVTAGLGAASVTAYQFDFSQGGIAYFDLAYIDTSVVPHRLHFGDGRSTSNDRSTPAKRPTTLFPEFWTKQ